jgi:FAD/FMN-containing dehydrogenase
MLKITTRRNDIVKLNGTTIEALESELRGELIRPGDSNYDEARAVWNGMIDRYPALIARPADVQDVVAAVNFGRENDLLIAVRGGGHNVAGHGTVDGGFVIDLSLMKTVEVDPEARIARAQGGVTLGEFDQATQAHGLVSPTGVVSETGIAGLTLGGGYGWLRNKYGLSSDNLVGAEVVRADGRVLRASETENTDLFWAIRGGGGNFGIVTTFEYRLYPLGPEVMFVLVFHHGNRAKEGLQFYREYVATAPDEVSTLTFLGIIPPGEEVFPKEIYGLPYIAFGAMYAGPPQEGRKILQPLRDFGEPLADFSGVMPYVEAQAILDEDYPAGELRYYWKSLNLMTLTDAAIERIVAHAREQPSPLSTTDLWPIGGAVQRVPHDATAFHGRHAAFLLSPEANWEDPEHDEANINWLRALVDDMAEFSDGSRYLNFAGFQEEGDRMMQDAFGAKYQRLAEIKQKYDPANLFRLNQNIKPAA